jgi:hypothetical protein
MQTFEELHELIQSAAATTLESEREVRWLDPKKVLGVARNQRGALEVFLCGPRLHPRSSLLRRHMQFDSWQFGETALFDANRIVLPSAPHFVPIAALIAEELLRNRAAEGELERAFAASEPIIELALRRTALPEEVVLGLVGELFFLDMLIRAAANSSERASVLRAWQGCAPGAHDFVFDAALVEVKTTTHPYSRHAISSLNQVDPEEDNGKSVLLLSLGVVDAASAAGSGIAARDSGLTLPRLVESILRGLGSNIQKGERNETQEILVRQVRDYGGDSSVGYDHDIMSEWDVYQNAYSFRFQRLYDMRDSLIRVLRHQDVDAQFVPHDSVRFTLVLPERVRGDLNPTTDLFAAVPFLLGREGQH